MPVASIQLYHFLEALVDGVNSAVESALEDTADEPVRFIPSSIDVGVRCSIEYDGYGLYVTPSNAYIANYYGRGDDATIHARLSPVPGRSARSTASTVHGDGVGREEVM